MSEFERIKPSAEQLERQRSENEAARREYERKLAATEAERNRQGEQRDRELEAAFKASCRAKYASLSGDDFERLWPALRDKELLERAEAAHAKRLADYGGKL